MSRRRCHLRDEGIGISEISAPQELARTLVGPFRGLMTAWTAKIEAVATKANRVCRPEDGPMAGFLGPSVDRVAGAFDAALNCKRIAKRPCRLGGMPVLFSDERHLVLSHLGRTANASSGAVAMVSVHHCRERGLSWRVSASERCVEEGDSVGAILQFCGWRRSGFPIG